MPFPDFLIVGPHRSGTSWLYENIKGHPEVIFARQKEVHYFCPHEKLRPAELQTSYDLSTYKVLFQQPLSQKLKKALAMLTRHGRLYHPVRGEATACYSIADDNTIRTITGHNPDIKIIMMIRNPVDRAWSHAKHYLIGQQNTRIEDLGEEKLKKFFTGKNLLQAGEYTKNIATWQQYLKPGHLFTGLFEDITTQPAELLKKVYSFLGVLPSEAYIRTRVDRVVNAGPSDKIPPVYHDYLNELFKDEFNRLKEQYSITFKGRK